MEIDLKEVMRTPEFINCLAGFVGEKFSEEMFNEWRSEHAEQFAREMEERVKILVANSVEEHRENVGRMVREALTKMTKEEAVKAMLGQQLPW